MQKAQLEAIRAEVLTLANDMKIIAGKLDFLMAAMTIEEPVQEIKADPSDPKLIEEWVQDNGYDFDDEIEEAVTCELDVNHYSSNVEISISKEVESYNRNNILETALTRYLEWASEQKSDVQEDTTNG